MTSDFYTNGEYTADISNKMRVPDRIMAHSDAGDWNQTQTHDHRDVFNMQVPDRISGFNEIDVPEARKGSLFYEKEVFDMKVPDKIAAHEDGGNWNETINHDHAEVINMKVPDKIFSHDEGRNWSEKVGLDTLGGHDHKEVINMNVPDKIAAHRESGNWSDTMHDQYVQAVNMQVPERIQLAGSDQHVSNRSTPRELELEHSVMHPTTEHVRVNTPPRSIKLEDLAYPTADDPRQFPPSPMEKSTFRQRQSLMAQSPISKDADTSLSTYTEQNLSPSEEIQLMKRQIAKLNHRLMATELENQQQQQRELVFTIAVSAYFLVKALVWINKSI